MDVSKESCSQKPSLFNSLKVKTQINQHNKKTRFFVRHVCLKDILKTSFKFNTRLRRKSINTFSLIYSNSTLLCQIVKDEMSEIYKALEWYIHFHIKRSNIFDLVQRVLVKGNTSPYKRELYSTVLS